MTRRNDETTVEFYAVRIRRDRLSGIAVYEEWTKDGVPHRLDGPAQISRDRNTGNVVRECWLRNGQIHRDDGPSVILRNATTGHIYSSEWFRRGEKTAAPRRPQRIKKKSPGPSTPARS